MRARGLCSGDRVGRSRTLGSNGRGGALGSFKGKPKGQPKEAASMGKPLPFGHRNQMETFTFGSDSYLQVPGVPFFEVGSNSVVKGKPRSLPCQQLKHLTVLGRPP